MKLTANKICSKVFGLSLVLALIPTRAWAEDDYCTKTRARAGSDAALLYAPSARLSGVKIPQTGVGAPDPTNIGATYQVRGELLLSATNMYKGSVVERAADADCDAHKSSAAAAEVIMHASDLGRLTGLREEIRYLDAQKAAWDAIAAKMQERYVAKTATLVEIEDVKTRVVLLERQRAQVRGDFERLSAFGFDPSNVDLATLAERVQTDANHLEHELVRVRALDPWDVSVSGGYVPPVFTARNDWYAMVSLTYNIGSSWHASRDTRYLEARQRELQTARYELPHQLGVLKKHVEIATTQARAELDVITARMAEVTANRVALTQSESTLAPHALAMLDLELIATGADKVFLEGLLRELGRIQEK